MLNIALQARVLACRLLQTFHTGFWHIPQLSASSKHKQLFARIQVDFTVPIGWFECLEVEASESAEQNVG